MKQAMKRARRTNYHRKSMGTTQQPKAIADDAQEYITAANGKDYPADFYHETGRTVYSTQQQVADEWLHGALPTKCKGVPMLTTGSGNFSGKQYPDGHGVLMHYSTVEAYRTKYNVLLINTECWSKGWAHCTTPSRSDIERHALPLTTLATEIDLNSIHTVERGRHPDFDTKIAVVILDSDDAVVVHGETVMDVDTDDLSTLLGDLR